jgi:hypothetical protein
MNYQIIADSNIDDLTLRVLAQIKKGWKPLGGLACDGRLFFQAMIREKK